MRTTLSSILAVACCAATACATHNGGGDDDGPGGDRPGFTDGVSTLGGFDIPGYEDGNRQVNLFNNPVNVAVRDGIVYVADFDNNVIRALDADGNATTVIKQEKFRRPFGMAFAADGTLFVSTDDNPNGAHNDMSGSIWKVDVDAKTATPLAADIGRPRSLTFLSDGRLVAADNLHHVIEFIDTRTGAVTPIAGGWGVKGMLDAAAGAARFSTPYGVVQNAAGNLVVCDFDNHRLREVTLSGQVSTLAGTVAGFADGAMSAAMFSHPQGLVKAPNGDLYVTDLGNFRIRKVSGSSITTVAGNGADGYADSDDLLSAQFHGLEGLTINSDGSMLYVADGTRGEEVLYNRVRQIEL